MLQLVYRASDIVLSPQLLIDEHVAKVLEDCRFKANWSLAN
jgi:hypothetical protein